MSDADKIEFDGFLFVRRAGAVFVDRSKITNDFLYFTKSRGIINSINLP